MVRFRTPSSGSRTIRFRCNFVTSGTADGTRKRSPTRASSSSSGDRPRGQRCIRRGSNFRVRTSCPHRDQTPRNLRSSFRETFNKFRSTKTGRTSRGTGRDHSRTYDRRTASVKEKKKKNNLELPSPRPEAPCRSPNPLLYPDCFPLSPESYSRNRRRSIVLGESR